MEGMNTELLSVNAKEVYNLIYQDIRTTMFNQLVSDGQEAFDNEDFVTAIDKLTKAKEILPARFNRDTNRRYGRIISGKREHTNNQNTGGIGSSQCGGDPRGIRENSGKSDDSSDYL